jgi:hypothetical protein
MSDPPWAPRSEDDTASTEGSDERTAAGTVAAPQPARSEQSDAANAQADDLPGTGKKRKKKTHLRAVVQALLDGERESAVAAWLAKKGLEPDQIEDTLSRAREKIQAQAAEREGRTFEILEQDERDQKRRHLIHGALWFGGGALLTIVTCSAATEGGGGGRYVLAWGPMLYGAFRMMRGL